MSPELLFSITILVFLAIYVFKSAHAKAKQLIQKYEAKENEYENQKEI